MFKKIYYKLSLCFMSILMISCSSFYEESNRSNDSSSKKSTSDISIFKKVTPEIDDKTKIKTVMKYFQKYYVKTQQYDKIFLRLFADNDHISIIYPNAFKEKNTSWAVGKKQIEYTFKRAFDFWHSISLYEDSYKIIVNGNSAYFTASGEAFLNTKYEKKLREFTRIVFANLKLKNETKFNRVILSVLEKILLNDKNDQLDHDIPFAVSAFFVKQTRFKVGEGNVTSWKIQSMHFSLPVDIRAVKDIRLL